MVNKHKDKRYEPSQDLCKKFCVKNPSMFAVDETIGNVRFFCSNCRKLFTIPVSAQCVCPVCAKTAVTKPMLYDGYPLDIGKFKKVDAMAKGYIDSVTVNKSWNGDQLKDENVTIWYRDYMWSENFTVQRSFSRYHRMIVSFENQQLYFTRKASGNKHVDFQHYKAWDNVLDSTSDIIYGDFKKYIKHMVNEVYEVYNLPSIYDGNQYTSSCLLTIGFLYNCLKFPIAFKAVMKIASSFGNNYKKNSDGRIIINSMCYWLYLASKIDSTLLHTLCASDEAVYADNVRCICDKFDKSNVLFDFCMTNPLGIVFAQNLHHYGFLRSQSVMDLANIMLRIPSYECIASVWLYELLQKRNHSRRKFWRRILTRINEYDLIDMIVNSKMTCDYTYYRYGQDIHADVDFTYIDVQQFYDNAVVYLSSKSAGVSTLDDLFVFML